MCTLSLAQTSQSVNMQCKDVKMSYQTHECCEKPDHMNASMTMDVSCVCPSCLTPDNGVVTDWSVIYADSSAPHAPITAYRVLTSTPNRFQSDAPYIHQPVFEQNSYGWWTPENSVFPRPRGIHQSLSPNTIDWSGPDDHSVTYQVAHDTSKIYLTMVVKDDIHVFAAPGTQSNDHVQIGLALPENMGVNATTGMPLKQMLINFAVSIDANGTHAKEIRFEKNIDDSQRIGFDFTWSRDEVNKLTTYVVHVPPNMFNLGVSYPENFQFGLGIANWDADLPGAQTGWSGLNADAILYCRAWAGYDSKCPQYTSLVTLSPHTPPSYMHAHHCSEQPCTSFMTLTPTPPMKTWKHPQQNNPSVLPTWATRQHLSNGWISDDDESFYNSDVNSAHRFSWKDDELTLTLQTYDTYHKPGPAPWAGDGVQVAWSNSMENVLTDCMNPVRPTFEVNVNIGPDANGTLGLGWSGSVVSETFRSDASFERSNNITRYHFKFTPADFGKTAFKAGDILPLAYIVIGGINNPDKYPITPGWKGQVSWSGVGQWAIVGGKRACATGFLTLDPGTAAERSSIFSAPEYDLKVHYVETVQPSSTSQGQVMSPAEFGNASWLNISMTHPTGGVLNKVSMSFIIDSSETDADAAHLTGLDTAQCGRLHYPTLNLYLDAAECWTGYSTTVWGEENVLTKATVKPVTTGTAFVCEAMFDGLTQEERQNVDPNAHEVCFTKKTKIDLEVPVSDAKNFWFLLKVTHKPKDILITRLEDGQSDIQFPSSFPWEIGID